MDIARQHMPDNAVSMEVGSRRWNLTWELNDGQDFASGAQGEGEDIRGEEMAIWKGTGYSAGIPNYVQYIESSNETNFTSNRPLWLLLAID